jgi:dihydrofolate reductase
MITLDGLFEGPDRDITWHRVDEEFNDFAIKQLRSADGLMFGRLTYELMAAYWPTAEALGDDPVVAGLMNEMPKVVASRTLDKVSWNNSSLVKEDITGEISRLKAQPGKDFLVFGSADLARTLLQEHLIDEIRVIIAPLVLGGGSPLFQEVRQPLQLKLLSKRVFKNGNVLLTYEPVKS